MISIRRLSSRFQDRVKYTIRRLSTGPPETFFLMGRHGMIPFSEERCVDLGTYLHQSPILERVPSDGLYGNIDVNQPFQTNNANRELLRSGLYLPHFSKIRRKSYSGAFRMGNVWVIEDLGLLAFKELQEDSDGLWLSNPKAGYHECGNFLEKMTSWRHPSSIGFQPDELNSWFGEMTNPIDEDLALYHPAGMTDALYEYLLVEVWKTVRQRFPQLHDGSTGRSVLSAIPQGLNVPEFVLTCQGHAILNSFLPESLRNPAFVISSSPPGGGGVPGAGNPSGGGVPGAANPFGGGSGVQGAANPGGGGVLGAGNFSGGAGAGNAGGLSTMSSGNHSANASSLPTITKSGHANFDLAQGIVVADTARHMSAHSDDVHLRSLLQFLPGAAASNFKNKPLGRELVRVFRYHAPLYLPTVSKALFAYKTKWEDLGLKELIPIPKIYSR